MRSLSSVSRGAAWFAAMAMFVVAVPTLAAGGRVTFASDNVTLERGGAVTPLEVDKAVQTGDVVATGETGLARLQMDDDSIVGIAPRSRFQIDEYSYDGSSGKSFYQLLVGGFRSITGRIGKGEPANYGVKTPVATLGIRGTDYTAYMCVSGSCNAMAAGTPDGLHIRVRSGGVHIENAAGSLDLGPGEFGFVANANTAPVKVPPVPLLFLADLLTDAFMFDAAAVIDALGIILDFRIHGELPVSPN